MKINQYQLISQLKEHDNDNYLPILLYGPNEGLIRENLINIKKNLKHLDAEEVSFTGNSISEKPELLTDEIKTVSMFNEQKIITIEQPLDKNVDLFQDCFSNIPKQTLIIVIGNNLSKSSKVRNYFEGSETYLSCASYEDDLKTNIQQIQELEKRIKKNFDIDIKNYLKQNLSTDRMISKNETDKIALLYSNNEEKPELDKIRLIFNDNSEVSLSKIPQIVFSGNSKKTSIFLNKIFAEGVNPVAIIRTMLNYVQRIKATQIALKKNRNFDVAIKGLKPPVFWKEKDLFKLHCIKWPVNETILNFNLLIDAELSCKRDYYLTNIYCEQALLKIALRGKKYFN